MDKKIGQLIKERVDACNMEVTEFAKAIDRERSNVYDIFKRDSIDTNLLKKIGRVLEYDFFQDLISAETIEKIIIREATKKSSVMIQLDLSEDEIMKVGFDEKILKILKK